MKTIYKFKIYDGATTKVPNLRYLLDVQLQDDDVVAWYEVDDKILPYAMILVGTGREIPEGFKYLKTIQDPPWVWHVYYRE